jgi:hypothetical protein
MKAQLRHHVAALLLLAPAAATFVATPAVAQQRAAAIPQISGLTLNADNGLEPGSLLVFAVQGTPGGRARVHLGGTQLTVPLRESSAGMYKATYTVRRADRIDPTAILTVRLTRANRTAVQTYTYPPSFQALAASAPPVVAVAPTIDRFGVRPVRRLEAGRVLRFELEGVPRARVSVDIPGVVSDVPMREVRPGVYEGSYTIRRRDDPDAFESAVASLSLGGRSVTARSERFERVAGGRDRDRDGDRDRPRMRDDSAPEISDLSPRNGEIVPSAGRTVVAAQFNDRGGSGVDPGSVRITLDGRDVTPSARVTADEFRYRSDLAPGRYRAEVTARDRAGNATTKSWTFDVAGTFGVGPAPSR